MAQQMNIFIYFRSLSKDAKWLNSLSVDAKWSGFWQSEISAF